MEDLTEYQIDAHISDGRTAHDPTMNLAAKQNKQRLRRACTQLGVSTCTFMLCWLAGVLFFKLVEGCRSHECVEECRSHNGCERIDTWVDALYMSGITMTTV